MAGAVKIFKGRFCYYLKFEDKFEQSLPLEKHKAKGGTLAMWECNLNAHVTILHSPSSAVLPPFLNIPDTTASVHIGVYMPMSGLDVIVRENAMVAAYKGTVSGRKNGQ